MIRLFHVYFPSRILLLLLSEAALIVLLVLSAMVLHSGGDVEMVLVYEQGVFKAGVAAAVLVLCMYYYDLYGSPVLHRFSEVLSRLVQVLGTASVILAALYYLDPRIQLGRSIFIAWILLAGTVLVVWRRLFSFLNQSDRLSDRTVLLGFGPMALSLTKEIESRPELGLKLVGYLAPSADSLEGMNGLTYLGDVEDLPAVTERSNVNRVILTLADERRDIPVEMLLTLKLKGLVVQEAGEVYEAVTGKVSLVSLLPSWLLFSNGFRVPRLMLAYKRTASLVLATVGIVLTAPLMTLIAIAIRIDSPGGAIFRQRRVGQAGRIFTIYKFRSMYADADRDGVPRPATPNDTRITRVGYWLRRLHLDELPQLFNILRGDMYFIGPRPFTPNMETELSRRIPFYSQRLIVKPGATGWAQVRRGYCETLEDNIEKLSYDLFYVKNLSVGLDWLILFETIKILILGRGGR